jgi:hypothetical protein
MCWETAANTPHVRKLKCIHQYVLNTYLGSVVHCPPACRDTAAKQGHLERKGSKLNHNKHFILYLRGRFLYKWCRQSYIDTTAKQGHQGRAARMQKDAALLWCVSVKICETQTLDHLFDWIDHHSLVCEAWQGRPGKEGGVQRLRQLGGDMVDATMVPILWSGMWAVAPRLLKRSTMFESVAFLWQYLRVHTLAEYDRVAV